MNSILLAKWGGGGGRGDRKVLEPATAALHDYHQDLMLKGSSAKLDRAPVASDRALAMRPSRTALPIAVI